MKPIAVFYHCLFWAGDPPTLRQAAVEVVRGQMAQLSSSGLLDAAQEFIVGLNGSAESESLASMLIPAKARIVMHGLQSRSENLTIVELEKWVKDHPDWNVLYLHSKGATHVPDTDYAKFCHGWRECMMGDLVNNWRQCVADLEAGWESVGCHFMRNMADGTQNIWAGNFWWATSNFLREVPSIFLRDRIKTSGIAALESRYEAEVWIGNGRLPKVKEYRPAGGGGCP